MHTDSQRRQHIARTRLRIERDSYPRLQMSFLVALTGAAGFIASFSLLQAGMYTMALRYPLAVGIAYLVFLFLLWLWLRTSASDYADLPDPSGISAPHRSSSSVQEGFSGKGGTADGGGASGNFELATDGGASLSDTAEPVGEALGAAAQADELAVPLVVIVMIAAVALSSLFVVYSAPLLFAELLVDAALAASLYRRLRGLESQHWLQTAVRRTFLPFLATACFMATVGWGLETHAPGARSIGTALLR